MSIVTLLIHFSLATSSLGACHIPGIIYMGFAALFKQIIAHNFIFFNSNLVKYTSEDLPFSPKKTELCIQMLWKSNWSCSSFI